MEAIRDLIAEVEVCGNVVNSATIDLETFDHVVNKLKEQSEFKNLLIFASTSFHKQLKEAVSVLSKKGGNYGKFDNKNNALSYIPDLYFFRNGVEVVVIMKRGLKKTLIVPTFDEVVLTKCCVIDIY